MTLRILAKKQSAACMLRTLQQLNIGLSNTVYGGWAGKDSPGYNEPTLADVIQLKKLIKENSSLLAKSVDRELTAQRVRVQQVNDFIREHPECVEKFTIHVHAEAL